MAITVLSAMFCLQIFTSKSFIVDTNNGFRARFLGFTVVVSNKTDHTDGTICYHDKHHNVYTLPAVLDIMCVVIGRYVIYYNERINGIKYPDGYSPHAFVDLCEVEVYG